MIDYDPHRWRDHFFDIKGSMVREIGYRVLSVVLWSVVVCLGDALLRPLAIPVEAHTLIGAALGLLMVFRTNASYDRFWEGRKLWGGIVNASRNLARSAGAYLPPATARPMIAWAIACPYAAMHLLRGTAGRVPGGRLGAGEIAALASSSHPPLTICRRIGQLLDQAHRRGEVGEVTRGLIDQNLQQLVDHIGGCERILRTPLPFAYVVHLRRALILYCFTFPVVIVKDFGWASVPAALLVAYVFFGIEEIGVEIENPFGTDENDLPLEDICAGIARSTFPLADEPVPTSS